MGLLQRACETYDRFADRAGVEYENEATLAPISHTIISAQIEITLDQDGGFQSARPVDKKEPKIVIPVTEASYGRTSAPCPHPLCEQLGYLADHDTKKHQLYIEQLTEWARSEFGHPMLRPILRYVENGTILDDLVSCRLIELDEKGAPKEEKALVRWVVNGLGDRSGPCWTDRELLRAFSDFYCWKRSAEPAVLCAVTGEPEPPALQHPKGIIPIYGNAKLISANDDSGFTYRGRFSKDWQAATVGYTASQKAHNALRWLIANQGIHTPGQTADRIDYGGRTFLAWNPQGQEIPSSLGPLRRRSASAVFSPTDYKRQLRETLSGWQTNLPVGADVVIAAFDAATTGRLSVAYYNELRASDFLERLRYWDETCCWIYGQFGIQSPGLYRIVQYAFGTQRSGKMEPPQAELLRQHMQRLVSCRIDQRRFPADIWKNLVNKASNLQIYDKSARMELLYIACAVVRKYTLDIKKEEWDMALDTENTDRSYLFGRLLAIAEKVEQDTYASGEEGRETNAMRLQSAFAQKPMSTWRVLEERLRPYYRRLKPGSRTFYQRITQEIVEKLPPDLTPALNRRLEDAYLIGYYHQRAALYTSRKNSGETMEQTTEEE